jgi:hypothetical protein
LSTQPECPSVTAFRSRVGALLAEEQRTGARRDIVIFALDGIPVDLGAKAWPHAKVSKLRSVFPTTSSSSWLSSLRGDRVAEHGIPGVAFKVKGEELINVFEYRGELNLPQTGSIFSDAAALDYLAVSIVGDWEPYDCTLRTEIFHGSTGLWGNPFFTADGPWQPEKLHRQIRGALRAILPDNRHQARLIWCFVDVDRHIHHHGYDEAILRFIELFDELALELAKRNAIVVAHSDHGLIRTRHSDPLAAFLASVQAEHDAPMGGAGRVRWFYPRPRCVDRLLDVLERGLPPTVRVCAADEHFEPGSLARSRVGEVLLIAGGEEFVTFSGHCFDHGSLSDTELYVPLALWMP